MTGRNNVIEAVRGVGHGGRAVFAVHIAREALSHREVRDIIEACEAAGVAVRVRPLEELRARFAEVRQHVVAEVEEFHYADFDGLADAAARRETALVVVLDGLEDPQNLGSLARSAEFLGADGIVIRTRRSAQVTPVVERVAAGALAHLPVARVVNIARAVDSLRDRGFFVVCAEADGEHDAAAFEWPPRCALVLGSEGSGVSRLVRGKADATVRVERRGHTPSLNVAHAGAILVHAWRTATAQRSR